MIELTEAEYLYGTDNNFGICVSCKHIAEGGCEPDAEEYECDNCGENGVMGYENALICGNITIKEEE